LCIGVVATTMLGCSLFDWATPFVKVGDAGDAVSDSPIVTDGGDAGTAWTCESITSDPDIKQKLPAIVPVDLPPNANVVSVAASDDLQQKINAAKPGDVLELEVGATFAGPFTLPAFTASGWIVIRTATPDAQLAMPGTRVSPALAPKMAKLTSSSSPVIALANGAGSYRIIGLEIESTTGTTVDMGSGGTHDVILDRVYAHGGGMMLQGQRVALIDSYSSGASVNNYAVTINGSGPVRITNDKLDSPGAHIWIEQGSDVEICQNAMTSSSGSNTANVHMTNASTVLIAGNVLDTIGITMSCTQGQQQDVTLAYNHTTHAVEYMYLSDKTTNVVVHDNLFDSSDTPVNDVRLFGSSSQPVASFKLDHNTFTSASDKFLYLNSPGPFGTNVILTNNIAPYGNYGVFGNGGSVSASGTAALDNYIGSYTYAYNALWGNPGAASSYPPNNFFPGSAQEMAFAADWSLTSSSPYKAKASDGKDIGADITTLTAATMNVP